MLTDHDVDALTCMMMTYHILLSDWFLKKGLPEAVAVEIGALGWLDDNFDRIAAMLR